MKVLRTLFLAIALAAGFMAASPAASAGDPQIDAAIAAGEVGERIDGLLGVVGDGDPSLIRKVQEINNKRMAKYAEIAADTNTTPAQVARVTGEKQIARLPSGAYYMDADGSWKRK